MKRFCSRSSSAGRWYEFRHFSVLPFFYISKYSPLGENSRNTHQGQCELFYQCLSVLSLCQGVPLLLSLQILADRWFVGTRLVSAPILVTFTLVYILVKTRPSLVGFPLTLGSRLGFKQHGFTCACGRGWT